MFDRFIGAMGGEGPIYYQAISAYAADKGITGHRREVFDVYLNAMDGEYLAIRREQDEKRAALEADKENKG